MDNSMKQCIALLGRAESLELRGDRCARLKRTLESALRELFIEPTLPAVRVSALALFCFNNGVELVTHDTDTSVKASFTVRAHGDTFNVSAV